MSEDSPLVDIVDPQQTKKDNSDVSKGVLSPKTIKTITLVVVLVAIILILYYAVICYSSNSKSNGIKKSKKKEDSVCDDFDVEKEVQKLRIKQDEFKARL